MNVEAGPSGRFERVGGTQAGVSSDQTINVLIAAGEALANTIEHGHRHSPTAGGDRRARFEQHRCLRGYAALDGQATLTIDLSGIDYLDSGAINLLFSHADRIELVVNPILLPVLKVSGLADVVNVQHAPPRSEK